MDWRGEMLDVERRMFLLGKGLRPMATQGFGEKKRGGPLQPWRPPSRHSRGPYSDVILKPFQVVMGWRFVGKVVVDCRFEVWTPRLRHWIDTCVRTRLSQGAYVDVWGGEELARMKPEPATPEMQARAAASEETHEETNHGDD